MHDAALGALDASRKASNPAVRRAHSIHPYPGMLARHIPQAILGGHWPGIGLGPGKTIFDPFCGAGTVLLEAQIAGLPSVGWDSNPLACLISRVKTQRLAPSAVRAALARVVSSAVQANGVSLPDVVNVEYWYSERACEGLSRVANAVNSLRPGATNDLLRLALSKTAMQLSLANPRFPVPVKLRLEHYREGSNVHRQLQRHLAAALTEDPIKRFESNVENLTEALLAVRSKGSTKDSVASVLEHDARNPSEPIGSPDLVLTSPPYPGAQKYSRFSSLSLGWLGLAARRDLRGLEDRLIGREHFRKIDYDSAIPTTGVAPADALLTKVADVNRLRAYIGAMYLIEMREAMKYIVSILSPTADVVIVAAPGRFVGHTFDTPIYLSEIARDEGLRRILSVDDTIRYRRLVTARRNGATPIALERILHFRRQI